MRNIQKEIQDNLDAIESKHHVSILLTAITMYVSFTCKGQKIISELIQRKTL